MNGIRCSAAVRSTVRRLFLLLTVSQLAQSCASFLTSGQLGYETMALPVAVPEEGRGASSSFVFAQASLPGSTFLARDHSMNLFVGAGTEWSTPAWNGFFLSVPVALSGFVGAASLSSGLEDQYPYGVFKPYYGGSLQIQPSLNFVTGGKDFRVALGGLAWANGEAGPYAEFRSNVRGDPGHTFVDDSPTPWSGGVGDWLEFSWGNQQRIGVRVTAAAPIADLRSNYAEGVIGRIEYWGEQDKNRFVFGYEAMWPLNTSLFFGYIRTL